MQSDLREAARRAMNILAEFAMDGQLDTAGLETHNDLVSALASTPAPCPASEGAAREIADKYVHCDCDVLLGRHATCCNIHKRAVCASAIAALIASPKPDAGKADKWEGLDKDLLTMDGPKIIDCTGEEPVVRKVLGTLPITADGCVVGHGGEIHTIGTNRDGRFHGLFQSSVTELDDFSAEPFDGSNWYSTEAAARQTGGSNG